MSYEDNTYSRYLLLDVAVKINSKHIVINYKYERDIVNLELIIRL